MKTVLATAYAINPYKGSEDGMGWNFARQIARHHKAIIITRENNRAAIEKYLAENEVAEQPNLQFLYFDLPPYARWWKRGQRGALLYFYLWQFFVVVRIKKLNIGYDVVHNLNFHNDWTPSFLWRLKKPFVWGPVGHHPPIPETALATAYGRAEWLANRARTAIKTLFWTADPFLHVTRKKAACILAMNSSARTASHAAVHQMPSVASDDMQLLQPKNTHFTIISVGRFVALKGFDLTLQSFAHFYHMLPPSLQSDVQLVLVGDGPHYGLLKKWCTTLKIEAAVRVVRWVQRDELRQLYNASHVFLFPSHEGAGMVVAEALSCGLPVVCLDNCGPGELIDAESGVRVRYTNYQQTVQNLATSLLSFYLNPRLCETVSAGARRRYETHLAWHLRGDQLKQVYESIA